MTLRDQTEAEIRFTAMCVLSVWVCACTMCEGSFSTGGSQGLVYRRLETANVLHSGTVRLHRLHVLVEDGKDLIVEDLILPDAVCHLLQGLSRQTTERGISRTTYERCVYVWE